MRTETESQNKCRCRKAKTKYLTSKLQKNEKYQ